MQESRLEYLLDKFMQSSCTGTEEEELMSLLSNSENKDQVKLLIAKVVESTEADMEMLETSASSILQSILERGRAPEIRLEETRRSIPMWTKVAAAVLILFIAGAMYWQNDRKNEMPRQTMEVAAKASEPVVPGGNHALLKLANGKIIVLDKIGDGTITYGDIQIRKTNGVLDFTVASAEEDAPITYNILSTPRGGQYQCLLPDGTQAWLNAESTLRFPSSFKGAATREVEMTGEIYFEVKSDKQKPFLTKVGTMSVQVLGTHFNLNAYKEEQTIKTSLLEGSIKVNSGGVSQLLKPGQQGIVNVRNGEMKITNPDMVEVVAWKNGLFHFDGADIYTIMGQIGRWYDVEVEFSGEMEPRIFAGKISRNAELEEVLKILELSNVKFTLTGRKIIVQ